MDLDSLKSDLDTAFSKIPPEMLSELSAFVFRHKDTFGTVIPALMEELFPHIKAVMMEKAMGILDVKEVEDAVMEVLGRHGVKPRGCMRCGGPLAYPGASYCGATCSQLSEVRSG